MFDPPRKSKRVDVHQKATDIMIAVEGVVDKIAKDIKAQPNASLRSKWHAIATLIEIGNFTTGGYDAVGSRVRHHLSYGSDFPDAITKIIGCMTASELERSAEFYPEPEEINTFLSGAEMWDSLGDLCEILHTFLTKDQDNGDEDSEDSEDDEDNSNGGGYGVPPTCAARPGQITNNTTRQIWA
jgi:hypothetical protein